MIRPLRRSNLNLFQVNKLRQHYVDSVTRHAVQQTNRIAMAGHPHPDWVSNHAAAVVAAAITARAKALKLIKEQLHVRPRIHLS